MDIVGVSLTQEEIIRLMMIVTDEDKEQALAFLKRLEKKVRAVPQSHCAPKLGESCES